MKSGMNGSVVVYHFAWKTDFFLRRETKESFFITCGTPPLFAQPLEPSGSAGSFPAHAVSNRSLINSALINPITMETEIVDTPTEEKEEESSDEAENTEGGTEESSEEKEE